MSCENICNHPRVNNIGVKFLATIKDQDCEIVDVSTALVKKIYFKNSEDTVLEKNASFETDGTDGKIYYISQDGDLSVAGRWKMQGYVEIGTAKLFSSIAEFEVEENLV